MTKTTITVNKVTGNTFTPVDIETDHIVSTKPGDKRLSSVLSPISIRDAYKQGILEGISSYGTKICLEKSLPIHVVESIDYIKDLIHM